MSLEKAMEAYAAALEKNAAALDRHTDVIQSALDKGIALYAPADTTVVNTIKVEKTEPAKSEEKPKRGPKPKAEKEEPKAKAKPEADEDDFEDETESADEDDFEEEAPSKLSADDIRALLMKVKDEKGADAARGILKELGVSAIAQIPEKDFDKTVKLAAKAGVKL